ncbi:MAG: hypothetical protein GWQ05_18610 [Verrucomicrobiaceae bacterium]|nr:hypothetical protein [Verrucomicrobiaceae bacterium]NCF92945.1 hypothetical protein [Verrucomicrobiaceae bacterium]
MLTDDQKETVRHWAAAGDSLSDIHGKIGQEFGITITYFDARMLVSELELSLNKPEAKQDEEPEQDDDVSSANSLDEKPIPGGVDITLDSMTQPKAMVSGKVTFSDGGRASWYVDQTGRLGLDPESESYQPSEDDVMAFQTQLQQILKSQGF